MATTSVSSSSTSFNTISLPSSTTTLPSLPSPLTNISSSTTPSSTTFPTIPSSSLSNISHLLPVKLDPSKKNYLVWRSQFEPLLRLYNLEGFLDGSNTCPSKLIAAKEGETTSLAVNPEYLIWFQQDQILLSWLISTLTEASLAHIIGHKSSFSVWKTLEKIYASSSQARIMQLKYQLHNIKKGDLSMSEYVQKAKSIADHLAAVTSPVSDSDLACNLLSGLPSSYDAFVTSINTRIEPVTLDSLIGYLLNQEILEEKNNAADLNHAAANIVNKDVHQKQYTNYHNNKFSRGGYRGRGRGRGRGRASPNHHFHGSYGHSRHDSYGQSGHPCQLCNRHGHSALLCPLYLSNSGAQNSPAAMLSTSYPSSYDPNWYVDSGATHHLTVDMANLSTHSEYNGPDQILVGNGKGFQGDYSASRKD